MTRPPNYLGGKRPTTGSTQRRGFRMPDFRDDDTPAGVVAYWCWGATVVIAVAGVGAALVVGLVFILWYFPWALGIFPLYVLSYLGIRFWLDRNQEDEG